MADLVAGGALDLLGGGGDASALLDTLNPIDTSALFSGVSPADASFVFNAPASFAPTVAPSVAPSVAPAIIPDVTGLAGDIGGGAVGGGLGGVGDVGGGLVAGGAGDLAGAGLLGALGPAAVLSLFALPFEGLFGFGETPPVNVANTLTGPIARSLGLPGGTSFQQLKDAIAGAGFTPGQIGGYLQQNLPSFAGILQEPGGGGLGQAQALGEILGSGLLGPQTQAVGAEFAGPLESEAVASGQVGDIGTAKEFLQAFGYIPPDAAPTAGAPSATGPAAGTPAAAVEPLALAGGAPSALGSIASALNPVGIAQASPAAGGGAGATGAPAASSNLVLGTTPGLPGAPAAPGTAPPELAAPDLSGLTSGGGGTAATTPPVPPPSATGPVAGAEPAATTPPAPPSAPPTQLAATPTPSTTPTTTPSGGGADTGLTPTPGYSNVAASTDPATPYNASGDYGGGTDSGGWFQNLKDFAKEYGPLIGMGTSALGLLSSVFGNKLPQQASSATQAANSALGPSNFAFNTAAGSLVPAATTNLAATTQTAGPIIAAQTQQAQREAAAAAPLLEAETTGVLPPGTADAIRSALGASRAGITSGAANLGQAGSSVTAEDVAAGAAQIRGQIPGILSNLVTQGTNLSAGATQSNQEALSGLNTILNAVQGLSQAVGVENQSASGVTNAAQVAANANLGFADLQLKADQELQTALAGLARNLALSNFKPSTVSLAA